VKLEARGYCEIVECWRVLERSETRQLVDERVGLFALVVRFCGSPSSLILDGVLRKYLRVLW